MYWLQCAFKISLFRTGFSRYLMSVYANGPQRVNDHASTTLWSYHRPSTIVLYITPSRYHHCANFIWRHWTYKMPVRYNLSSVWVRLSISSQLSIIQYVGLCVLSLPISFVMIDRIYILCLIIITTSEVWTITHCLGLGHAIMVCAVCLSIFLKNVDWSITDITIKQQPKLFYVTCRPQN